MLVFKNNIYETFGTNNPNVVITPNTDYNERFNPHHLIKVALHEEKEVICFINRQPQLYWREDLLQFYPYAGKTNSLNYINQICQLLEDGLEKSSIWLHMNSYHFSFLFDVLVRFVFNYNHENNKERINYLPELEAQPIPFENFLSKQYLVNILPNLPYPIIPICKFLIILPLKSKYDHLPLLTDNVL